MIRPVSLPRGIPSFTMTKNRLFWEPGLGSRSDNFSHVGMTHWGVFGARGAPKSMCTHQAHRLKKIDEKGDFYEQMAFCVPNVRKSFLGCADRKTLLIYPFLPSEYPYFEYSTSRTNFMTLQKWVPNLDFG